jgi:hypothetical protein
MEATFISVKAPLASVSLLVHPTPGVEICLIYLGFISKKLNPHSRGTPLSTGNCWHAAALHCCGEPQAASQEVYLPSGCEAAGGR